MVEFYVGPLLPIGTGVTSQINFTLFFYWMTRGKISECVDEWIKEN